MIGLTELILKLFLLLYKFWGESKIEKAAQIACRVRGGQGSLGNAQKKLCFFFFEDFPYSAKIIKKLLQK